MTPMRAGASIHVMHEQPLLHAGLLALLASREWRTTSHCTQADAMATADILVAGYETGLELAAAPAAAGRARRIMIVTRRDKPWEVRRALDACVAGYVHEDSDAAELRHALRRILGGAPYLSSGIALRIGQGAPQELLTRREQDVLGLLAKGLCNKRIARALDIEVGTVKAHVRGLMAKLGASARTHAVVTAARLGLIGIEAPAQG